MQPCWLDAEVTVVECVPAPEQVADEGKMILLGVRMVDTDVEEAAASAVGKSTNVGTVAPRRQAESAHSRGDGAGDDILDTRATIAYSGVQRRTASHAAFWGEEAWAAARGASQADGGSSCREHSCSGGLPRLLSQTVPEREP
jgi:hypothetical protein